MQSRRSAASGRRSTTRARRRSSSRRPPIPPSASAYPLPGTEVLDARETIGAILRDLGAGVPVATVAARFHNGVARGAAHACAEIAARNGVDLAVLSGGVFQNRLLLERTAEALERAGLRVLVPRPAPAERRRDRLRAGGRGGRSGRLAQAVRRAGSSARSDRGRVRVARRPPAAVLHRMGTHRPGVPSQSAVALSQGRLQLSAMLATRVARPPVDPIAGPVQPVPRLDVEVLAEEELLKLRLQCPLRRALGPHAADSHRKISRLGIDTTLPPLSKP